MGDSFWEKAGCDVRVGVKSLVFLALGKHPTPFTRGRSFQSSSFQFFPWSELSGTLEAGSQRGREEYELECKVPSFVTQVHENATCTQVKWVTQVNIPAMYDKVLYQTIAALYEANGQLNRPLISGALILKKYWITLKDNTCKGREFEI